MSSVDSHVQELLDDVQEVLWREYYHPGCNTRPDLTRAIKKLKAVRLSITMDKIYKADDEGPAGRDGGPSVTDDGVSCG